MNLNRRKIIQAIAGSSLLLGLSSMRISNASNFSKGFASSGSESTRALVLIYQEWTTKESLAPLQFIEEVKSSNINKTLNEIVQSDFNTENTININGLILSKYEAAHLAELSRRILPI